MSSSQKMKNNYITGLLLALCGVESLYFVGHTQTTALPSDDTLLGPIELRASAIKTDNYPVDLAAVLQLVEDQNLAIAQTRKGAEISQSQLRQKQVAILPNIDGTYVQSNLQGAQQVFGTTVQVTRKTVQPQIGASWTLYPGGKTIYDMLAAKRRKDSADFLLKQTDQEQLAGAAQDYYKLLAAYQQKNSALQSMSEAKEQVSLNQAKIQTGKGIPLDLSRAQTQYAQRQSALLQAESGIIQAEQALLNRLNLDPTIHLVPNEPDEAKKSLVSEDIPVARLIEQAVAQNPSLKTLEEELKAMGYDYKSIRSDLLPSVTLRTYLNGTGQDFNTLARTTFGGITVNMNLLSNLGLQVPFRMQEQKKKIEQKILQQQALTRDVQSRVMTAFLSGENYHGVMRSAEQELASAQESYQLAVGRFKAGYGVNLDVLDAESVLATARANLAQATLNYNQAQVQLVQAIGQVTPDILLHGLKQGSTQDGH